MKGLFPKARRWRCLAFCSFLLCAGAPAYATSLVILPTFGSSITSLSGAAAIEAAIDSAIAEIEGDITSPNNITVKIDFENMTTGLGQSDSTTSNVSYFSYYTHYEGVATSANQLAALTSLGAAPSPGSANPVNSSTQVNITSAEGRNLGFNTPGGVVVGSGTFDSEISLNTSITSPPNGLGGNYSLEAVALHEIDEALGIGGTGSTIGGSANAPVGDLDLFRYTAPGVRSYSTLQTTSPYAYFSIDGGNTVLSYFSQTGGTDYADWLSNPIPAGYSVQVQDAFGQQGANPSLGVNELTAFNVIGYRLVSQTPSVPEPSTFLLSGSLLAIAAVGRRRIRNGRR